MHFILISKMINIQILDLRMVKLYKAFLMLLLLLCGMGYCGVAAEILLRVDKGTGISFLKLWDLKEYHIDTPSVYRSCLIDKPFTEKCPSNIYFNLKGDGGFNIHYKDIFRENSLQVFKDKVPISASFNSQEKLKLILTPNDEVISKGIDTQNTNQIFFAIYFKENTIGYPKYFAIKEAGSKTISNIKTDFIEYNGLEISAKYGAGCNQSNTCTKKTIAEIKDLLAQTPTSTIRTTTSLGTTAATDNGSSNVVTTTATDEPSTSLETTAATENTNSLGSTSTIDDESTTASEGSASLQTTTDPDEPSTTLGETTPNSDKGTVATASKVTTQDPTAEKMCPCDCEFKRRLEILNTKSDIPIEELKIQLAPEIEELKKSLTVDVEKLASTRRKKISAADKRKSSEQIGYVGAIIISIVFGLVILIDIVAIKRFYRVFRRNVLRR